MSGWRWVGGSGVEKQKKGNLMIIFIHSKSIGGSSSSSVVCLFLIKGAALWGCLRGHNRSLLGRASANVSPSELRGGRFQFLCILYRWEVVFRIVLSLVEPAEEGGRSVP